jgi:hypothetical protein
MPVLSTSVASRVMTVRLAQCLRALLTLDTGGLVNAQLLVDVKSDCLSGGDPRRACPAADVAQRRWLPSLRTSSSAFAAAWLGWRGRALLAGAPPLPVPSPRLRGPLPGWVRRAGRVR